MPRFSIWTATLAMALAAGAIAQAAEGDARPHVKRLLTLAREPSTKSLRAVEQYYRSLREGYRQQALVKYAYAVALIQQRRLHDAAKLVRELAEKQPEEFAFCRAEIWLALALGERTRALTEIEQLAGHAHAHRQAEKEPLNETNAAEFFGAVCGFFAGPWSAKIKPANAQRIEDHLRAVFNDESRAAFDRSKASVAEHYETLRQAHEERVQAERAVKTKQLEKAKESVAQADKTLSAKQQSLKDKEKRRDREAKAKLEDLDDEVKKIDERRQSLLTEIAPLEAQRIALVSQLVPLPLPSSRRQSNINALGGLMIDNQRNRTIGLLLAPIVTRLTKLETELASLNSAEQEYLFSIGVTEIKHQCDLGKIAQQEQSLQKDKKRIEYDARRLDAKPVASSARLRAEAEQLTRFSTYVPFDFEREQTWLLDQLANE